MSNSTITPRIPDSIERVMNGRPQSLEEVREWIAAHEARCEERHRTTSRDVDRIQVKAESNSHRIGKLEMRLMFWSGAAAAIGGGLGTFITRIMG